MFSLDVATYVLSMLKFCTVRVELTSVVEEVEEGN